MPEPRHWYLVLYDVSEPKRLRMVHKKLKGWGRAVQYSVFQVRATKRELEKMRCELSALLKDSDRLLLVRLCATCAQRVQSEGSQAPPFEGVPDCHIVG